MLWRACRGNVFLRQAEIETPLEDPSTVRFENMFRVIYMFFYVIYLFRAIKSTSLSSSFSSKVISLRLELRKFVRVSEPLCIPVRRRRLTDAKWRWGL